MINNGYAQSSTTTTATTTTTTTTTTTMRPRRISGKDAPTIQGAVGSLSHLRLATQRSCWLNSLADDPHEPCPHAQAL